MIESCTDACAAYDMMCDDNIIRDPAHRYGKLYVMDEHALTLDERATIWNAADEADYNSYQRGIRFNQMHGLGLPSELRADAISYEVARPLYFYSLGDQMRAEVGNGLYPDNTGSFVGVCDAQSSGHPENPTTGYSGHKRLCYCTYASPSMPPPPSPEPPLPPGVAPPPVPSQPPPAQPPPPPPHQPGWYWARQSFLVNGNYPPFSNCRDICEDVSDTLTCPWHGDYPSHHPYFTVVPRFGGDLNDDRPAYEAALAAAIAEANTNVPESAFTDPLYNVIEDNGAYSFRGSPAVFTPTGMTAYFRHNIRYDDQCTRNMPTQDWTDYGGKGNRMCYCETAEVIPPSPPPSPPPGRLSSPSVPVPSHQPPPSSPPPT